MRSMMDMMAQSFRAPLNRMNYQGLGEAKGEFDYTVPEVDYWQERDDDFDESDRPMIYPNESYGKYTYPIKSEC